MKLSVAMTAFNAEHRIAQTLQPLMSLADEVVVIDSFSTDNTPAIARAMGATVIQEPWRGYIAQRAFSMEKTSGEWILALDSDEVLGEDLARAIRDMLEKDDLAVNGYYINRRTFYMNRLLRHAWQPDWRLRLLRRSANPYCYGTEPHDSIGVEGKTARLPGYAVHYSYRDFADHMQRSRSHAETLARSYHAKGKKAGPLDLLLRPPFVLFKRLVLQGAFLDGMPGVMAAMSGAAYSYMKYAFLWELNTRGGAGPEGEKKGE